MIPREVVYYLKPLEFHSNIEPENPVTIVCIHKNEQLLDLSSTRLLFEASCIKTSKYLQVKGIDFDPIKQLQIPNATCARP